jgi:hypothetical protein
MLDLAGFGGGGVARRQNLGIQSGVPRRSTEVQ